jgi:hypothetical protein
MGKVNELRNQKVAALSARTDTRELKLNILLGRWSNQYGYCNV